MKVFFRILNYSYKYKALFFFSSLCAVASAVFAVMGPRIVGDAVTAMKRTGFDISALYPLLTRLAGIYLSAAVLAYIYSLTTNLLTQYTVRNLRNELFARLSVLPIKYLDGKKTGDLVGRMINDIEAVGDGLISNVTLFIAGAATISATLVSMMIRNAAIASLVVCLTPAAFFAAYKLSKKGKKYFGETQKNLGSLNAYSNEMITGQKTVKAYSYEQTAESKFGGLNVELYNSSITSQFISSMVNPIVRYISLVTYVLVGIVCAAMGVGEGTITAFLMYSNQYARPFMDVTSVVTQLQSAIAAAERIFSVLDQPPEEEDRANAVTLSRVEGEIVFDDVSFSYEADKPLIKNFSLRVSSGQKVAIVGPTGSGKTTLVNLLMRFYDPDGGAIYIDGHDIRDISRDSLRSSLGMVLQDTYLYTGTVRENIAYGKPEATEDEIIAAAKLADCYDFVTALEMGFDTVISDTMMNISKGQKQLIFIARIMLKLPPVLVLDEATSSIDAYIEIKIRNAFDAMMRGRTSFVVAHRLSTILNADLILVMRDGDVVEKGSHEELMSANGFYSRLYHSQYD